MKRIPLFYSGNQAGDVGARLLAKALQINQKLISITYDRNNITLQGFSDLAYGLERYVSWKLYFICIFWQLSFIGIFNWRLAIYCLNYDQILYRHH